MPADYTRKSAFADLVIAKKITLAPEAALMVKRVIDAVETQDVDKKRMEELQREMRIIVERSNANVQRAMVLLDVLYEDHGTDHEADIMATMREARNSGVRVEPAVEVIFIDQDKAAAVDAALKKTVDAKPADVDNA